MLKRRGSWRAALGLGRPRRSRLAPGSRVDAPPTHLTPSIIRVDNDRAKGKEAIASPSSYPFMSIVGEKPSTLLLAALSENVMQMREDALSTPPLALPPDNEGPLIEPLEKLQHALASRDAFCVFRAVLRQYQGYDLTGSCAAPKSEVEELLRNAEGEAHSVATMLCACVAVTLSPPHWPPWVTARFKSSGAASIPVSPSFTPGSGAAGHSSLAAAVQTWVPLSPVYPLTAHTLRCLVQRLPRPTGNTASSSLPLLRWLAQLCGVCLAPSPQAAMKLAQEVGKVSLDAAGVALKTHGAASVLFRHDDTQEQQLSTSTALRAVPQEERWLSLWSQLTQPSAAPPSLPPFSLPTSAASGAAESWSSGLQPAVLREARMSWHLHCLLTVKEVHHAARLLAGAFKDASLASSESGKTGKQQCDDPADFTEGQRIALPVTHATQAELLASLPLPLLEEGRLGERLSFSLLAEMQHTMGVHAEAGASPPPQPLRSFVPAVSTHAVVYARMLRYILSSTAQVQHERSYVQHLHDLALLLSSANVHALAASLVPADQPLSVVMVATRDMHREEYMLQLVSAVRAVVEVLCEEPTPLSTSTSPSASSSSGAHRQQGDALDTTTKALPLRSAPRKRNARQADAHSLRVQQATNTLGAFSWKWREEVMRDVDDAVQAAAHLLTSLLELCSSRKTSLPLRHAEPKWRRELRERTAVRAHKFEVLLQELPHAEIRAVLHTLLGHGYHREGSQLGVSLLKGDQVDLRYYTLPLLGSLYLALSTSADSLAPASTANETKQDDGDKSDRWRQAVYEMYRRRFEIYGDADLNVSAPSYITSQIDSGASTTLDGACATSSSPSTSTATALVRTPQNKLVEALVLASTTRTPASLENGIVELANCFLNRRIVAAGRGVVVDVGASYSSQHGGPLFGPWIQKGTTTL